MQFNHIIQTGTSQVNSAFLLTRQQQTADLVAPALITDNTITGQGPAAGGDSSQLSNWTVHFALREVASTAPVTDTYQRNTVDGSFVGLDARGPTTVLATDNHISNTYSAIDWIGTAPLVVHRNDFVNFH